MSTRKTILRGVGANAYGQAISLAIQLASIPLFLSFWSAEVYGSWILLNAIPGYLLLTDLGFTSAAATGMTIAVAQKKLQEATNLFDALQLLTLATSGTILIAAAAGYFTATHLVNHNIDEIKAVSILAISVAATLAGGLAEAAYRSTSRYATFSYVTNSTRLVEWLGQIAGLMIFQSFEGVAACGAVLRVLMTAVVIYHSTNNVSFLHWQINLTAIGSMRRMIKPAVAGITIPIANAISIQGSTLLVGFLIGSQGLTQFTVYRTLGRSAIQFTSIFTHAVSQEFTRIASEKGRDHALRLYKKANAINKKISIAFGISLLFTSNLFVTKWTHGSIETSTALAVTTALYATFGSLWHTSRIYLISQNLHERLAMLCLISAIVQVMSLYPALFLGSIPGAIIVLAIFELLLAAQSSRLVQKTSEVHFV